MITRKGYNVGLANLPDKKLMFDFGEKLHFDEKTLGVEKKRDQSVIRLLPSPAIMVFGFFTKKLQKISNELCDKLNLLGQGKQAGTNSDIFIEEIVAIADELLEYKCVSTKRQKFLLLKCLI